jgi:BolA protein
MALQAEIHQRLQSLAPEELDVINESHLHAGHAGDDGSGESHWRVVIRASQLDPMTRIARHRAIHAAIGPDLMPRIHALAIEIR